MKTQHIWLCSIAAAMVLFGVAQAKAANAPEPQRSFASPEEAVNAFVAALRDDKEADLRAILGPEADRVIDSGDRYADRELHQRFVSLYDQKHAIDRKGAGRAGLDVGRNDWPPPITLVEREGRWTFDTEAGAQTIIDRWIGRNELSAIRTLLASVDAQRDYFDRVKQANGRGAYATRFVSTPGHYDGLYWPVGEGENESPLGPLIDAARENPTTAGLSDARSVCGSTTRAVSRPPMTTGRTSAIKSSTRWSPTIHPSRWPTSISAIKTASRRR